MKRNGTKTRKVRKVHWTLTTPNGTYLASGTAYSAPEARETADAKLAALGRKRGNVKIGYYSAAAQRYLACMAY